jgi:hypothetical protein
MPIHMGGAQIGPELLGDSGGGEGVCPRFEENPSPLCGAVMSSVSSSGSGSGYLREIVIA